MESSSKDPANPKDAEARVRSLIALGIATTFLGLAIASTVHKTLGGILSIAGWGALAYAVHRLGRLG